MIDPPNSELASEEVFGPLVGTGLRAELADVALEAARAAAELVVSAATLPRSQVDTKSSPTDMVSEVDRGAEAIIGDVIGRRRRDDGLLGEEGARRDGSTGVVWVVDPLDGTTNFLFGVPQFAVSVAAEVDGEALVGVVIDASRQETWAAVRGGGARLDGVPCRVAVGRSALGTALVSTGFAYRREARQWQARVAAHVVPAVRDIRRLGSAALDLCWVAGGRVDAYYEWGLQPWDLSAGQLIASEAGGHVEVLPGGTVMATTPELADPLRRLLSEAGGLSPPPEAAPR